MADGQQAVSTGAGMLADANSLAQTLGARMILAAQLAVREHLRQANQLQHDMPRWNTAIGGADRAIATHHHLPGTEAA